jgi:hypothetical protein
MNCRSMLTAESIYRKKQSICGGAPRIYQPLWVIVMAISLDAQHMLRTQMGLLHG